MTTELILYSAIAVFLLMLIGIVLTVAEYSRLDDEARQRDGARPDREVPSKP